MEYERLPISKTSFKAVDYWGENGVAKILSDFAKINGWDYIMDGNNVIGLAKGMIPLRLNPVPRLK